MSRRPSLPGAAELFRSTGGPGSGSGDAPPPASAPAATESRRAPERAADRLARLGAPREEEPPSTPDDDFDIVAPEPAPAVRALRPSTEDDFAESVAARAPARIRQTRRQPLRGGADRQPSGREKHDEKITVYCSAEELFELERARLALRGDHGMVVDRGRIVREAVAVVLADLDAKGESSILVRRLRES
ncbi:MAG TPA: hypothetical protein VGP36_06645 [Mycobacteriales bacterium]|nr:hypothetical protein [Mycobacteriales bacterium]